MQIPTKEYWIDNETSVTPEDANITVFTDGSSEPGGAARILLMDSWCKWVALCENMHASIFQAQT